MGGWGRRGMWEGNWHQNLKTDRQTDKQINPHQILFLKGTKNSFGRLAASGAKFLTEGRHFVHSYTVFTVTEENQFSKAWAARLWQNS